jgi:electron transport complex protein RnfD
VSDPAAVPAAVLKTRLTVSPSPHAHSGASVRGIMLDVVIALAPACVAAVWFFRVHAVLLLVVCVAACLATEAACRAAMRRDQTLGDLSALVTGILLALNLPPNLPLWQAALGSVVAIAVAKQVFGGIGYNPFNPALIGRAFLLISFTAQMTTWSASTWSGVDALATATPLGVAKDAFKSGSSIPFEWTQSMIGRLFTGDINGCIGETSALALLLGGAYLLARRVITWHVPVSYIGTVAVYAAILRFVQPNASLPVLVHLLSGGLMLGAFFMATDMVTTPVTRRGLLVFGVGCGLLTMILRTVPTGAYPEGVSFAILIMNAFTPLINRATRPRRFGAVRRK